MKEENIYRAARKKAAEEKAAAEFKALLGGE